MKKRLLFLFKDVSEIAEAIKFLEVLENKYTDIEVDALYVRDITKYDIYPATVEGVGVQNTLNILLQEYKALENHNFSLIEEELKNKFSKIYSKDGETVEIVLEELKGYDMMIVVKNEELSSTMKELLKYHYKPMIILSKTDKEYRYDLDNVLMLNDGGYRANKSVFSYLAYFKNNITVLRVNVAEVDKLKDRFGSQITIHDEIGEESSIILDEIKKYGMIIMGDLQFSVFWEKLSGSIGIKIIEKAISPIYIG